MSKRRRKREEDDDSDADDELLAPDIILICEHCGERHAFESLEAASLMEGTVNCDNCGKPFIGPAIERRQAFVRMMRENPSQARKLASNPLWLEAFIRGKKIPRLDSSER